MKKFLILLLVGLVVAGGLVFYLFRRHLNPDSRGGRVIAWLTAPNIHPEWAVTAREKCTDAPFIFPTSGYIGYLWDDSFRIGHHHSGLDIFGGTKPGETEVYAAYSGYLTRLPDWKSSLIIRVPHNPLNPQQQIWLYYTHLADPQGKSLILADFPPGANEIYVEAGTLLGYQGNYSGTPGSPTGVHLHFSIVKDDGSGHFLNEMEIKNTLDPSSFFNLPLNGKTNRNVIPVCENDVSP